MPDQPVTSANVEDVGQPKREASLAAPTGYASLEIKLKGDTAQELWSSLLGLVCYAWQCKQAQDGHWPHMVSTDDGKITVRHNDKLSHGPTP